MLGYRETAKKDLMFYLGKANPDLKENAEFRIKVERIVDNIIQAAVIEARKSLKEDIRAAVAGAFAEETRRKGVPGMYLSHIEARREERRKPRGGS
jgi:hypothetical protein